jgi:hypothetical protein
VNRIFGESIFGESEATSFDESERQVCHHAMPMIASVALITLIAATLPLTVK